MLSPPHQIPEQLLLYKTTTCLTWPATTFFVSQMKKAYLKQPLKSLSSKEMGNMYKEKCIKNKRL